MHDKLTKSNRCELVFSKTDASVYAVITVF